MHVTIIAVTRSGALLGDRLRQALPASTLCVPARFHALAPEAEAFEGPVAGPLARAFRRHSADEGTRGGLVLVMALGLAVRLLAPHIGDKRRDPAVVVVDDQGRFAISALSGHLGGANALARQVAALIGAQPVVTTASDAAGTIAVDLLGRHLGWRTEEGSDVTSVSAAVVNGEPVGLLQEAGEQDWWPAESPLPPNISLVGGRQALAGYRCGLIITDRLIDIADVPPLSVVYRPRSLVVGVGCNRRTESAEIEEAISAALAEARLSPRSIRNLATIEGKRDEAGLRECAARNGWAIDYFTADELNAIGGISDPSPMAFREVGAWGVCEPAALRSAGAGELLVSKRKRGNVTVAIARVQF